MTIREIHMAKLAAARLVMARHAAQCTETGECETCDTIAQEIESRREALDKIDAGIKQMRIASQ